MRCMPNMQTDTGNRCDNRNNAVCDYKCSPEKRRSCKQYNRNILLNEYNLIVLEHPCPKKDADGVSFNEECYNPKNSKIRCKTCSDKSACPFVLSPKMVTSPFIRSRDDARHYKIRNYSEFSGCTTLHAPGCLTIDIKKNHAEGETLFPVQTIQFLLWDNRGCDKREACDVKIRYRLLVSACERDLVCDETTNKIKNEESVQWIVLHDTLRNAYNGWQVFHLEKPIHIRYIRIHFISGDEDNRCNIVRIGAYSSQLVGYPYYESLPTLTRTLDVVMPDNPEAIDPSSDTPAGPVCRATENSIAQFPENLRALIHDKLLTEQKSKVSSRKWCNSLQNLEKDFDILIKDLYQYDNRISLVKNKIISQTKNIMSYSDKITLTSFLWSVISIITIFTTDNLYVNLGLLIFGILSTVYFMTSKNTVYQKILNFLHRLF